MKKIFISISALLMSGFLFSQTQKRPDNWFNLDPTNDKVNGVSTERAYKELLKDKKPVPVIVAVLDSGVDYYHEDLKDVMWTNPGEIAGNGIDDDKNGYIDDIHGWSFIGGKDGKNVDADNLEMTRIYRKLKPKYEDKTKADFKTKEEKAEFELYQEVKTEMSVAKSKYEPAYNQMKFLKEALTKMESDIKAQQGVSEIKLENIEKYTTEEKSVKQVKAICTLSMKKGNSTFNEFKEQIDEGYEQMSTMVEIGLNPDVDPRTIVGDNYEDAYEKNYGNADCKGPHSFHGTHVAGIIAAARNNGKGMDGVAADVKIMAVRCVPNGDERDKDIANAIIYAVDNGAKILNMSFGKRYSWNKKVVDDAVKYAQSKGVLLMHAAGNDHLNIDEITHYPTAKYEGKGYATNMITIGALSWKPDSMIAAPFTNYGKKSIDLFAPGVDIYSTAPEQQYKDASGTSMATPVAAGVAAVLKSYYPSLSPEQIKTILIKSSLKTYKGKKVIKPGSKKGDKDRYVKFESLGKNAGLINLYEAIQMADKFTKKMKA
ncbi:MAG: S8 family peptidase [Sphingobacteriaceae bacterium]